MINVIGAGTAGLYTSYLLAKKGYNVNVFDKKLKIGSPVQCTGILTSKINSILNVPEKVIQNKIKKIEVNSKNFEATFKLKNPDLILDRSKFDIYIGELAKKEGVNIFMNHAFLDIKNNWISINNLNSKKIINYKSNILIGADGPFSKIYQIINSNKKRYLYKGIQFVVEGDFDKDTFQVYLGSICPGFFAWVVPQNKNQARIGLAANTGSKRVFDNFLGKIGISKNSKIVAQGGLIPIYDPKISTKKGNTYLVGDSAGQIKSTTGGGIIQGLSAARILANSIQKKLNYENEWRKKIGFDLWIHLKLRNYLDRFTDQDYDRLIKILKRKNVGNILETIPRDTPSKLLANLLFTAPDLAKFGLKIFNKKLYKPS